MQQRSPGYEPGELPLLYSAIPISHDFLMLASFSGASPEARTRLLLGAAGLQSAGRPPGHTMHIMEEVERIELPYARISDIRWFSGPVPYRSATLPNLAEKARFRLASAFQQRPVSSGVDSAMSSFSVAEGWRLERQCPCGTHDFQSC